MYDNDEKCENPKPQPRGNSLLDLIYDAPTGISKVFHLHEKSYSIVVTHKQDKIITLQIKEETT